MSRQPSDARVPRTEACVWWRNGIMQRLYNGRAGSVPHLLPMPPNVADGIETQAVVLMDARDEADTRALLRLAADRITDIARLWDMLDMDSGSVADHLNDVVMMSEELASRLRAAAGP